MTNPKSHALHIKGAQQAIALAKLTKSKGWLSIARTMLRWAAESR